MVETPNSREVGHPIAILNRPHSQRVIVGQIAGAHGIGGEVRARILADDAALLLGAKRFALSRSGPEDPQATEIENQGGTTGRPGEVRLRLRGVVDRDAAEALRGTLPARGRRGLRCSGRRPLLAVIGCAVETAAGERSYGERLLDTVRRTTCSRSLATTASRG
jgi:hypothetical protein